MFRQFPRRVKTVVVKVGSSLIADYQLKPSKAALTALVEQIASLRQRGINTVLVSSGAIVLGMGELGLQKRPGDLASLQACAAVGQAVLMRDYMELFRKNGGTCAQILLTWDDFDNRARHNNACNTLKAIVERGVTPIVNENDTISTEEIKFGDNDKLSALVASMIGADLLVILSDIEGFYQVKDGKRETLQEIKEITLEIENAATGSKNKNISKGGMITKLDAIKIAAEAKVPCIIANGRMPDVLTKIVTGERIGTFFVEKEEKLLARKHWISFGAKPKGMLTIDDGAKQALLQGGRSLLLPGVVSWEGHFKADDVVVVKDQSNCEIARGIINYSLSDLHKLTDKKDKREVIHRNDLVLCQR